MFRVMSQKLLWKIQYINLCINEFARKYRLTPQMAYNYLNAYKGLSFLDECYEAEHTDSLMNTMDNLKMICVRNGGSL